MYILGITQEELENMISASEEMEEELYADATIDHGLSHDSVSIIKTDLLMNGKPYFEVSVNLSGGGSSRTWSRTFKTLKEAVEYYESQLPQDDRRLSTMYTMEYRNDEVEEIRQQITPRQ